MNYRSCQTRIIRLFLLARRLRPTCCFLNQKPAVISIKSLPFAPNSSARRLTSIPASPCQREALPARSLAAAKPCQREALPARSLAAAKPCQREALPARSLAGAKPCQREALSARSLVSAKLCRRGAVACRRGAAIIGDNWR